MATCSFTTVTMAGDWSLGNMSGDTCATMAIIWRNILFRRFSDPHEAQDVWNKLCQGADPLDLEPESDFMARWFTPHVTAAH